MDAYTSPMEKDEFDDDDAQQTQHDASIQVNFVGSMGTSSDNTPQPDPQVNCIIPPKDTSSILVQTDELSTSNAVIQTEETLETYKILGQLLASWSSEIQVAKAKEEESDLKCREFEQELNKLRKQFKLLQKVATTCRKESKRREEVFKQEIDELKARHVEVLQKLDQKLNVL